MAPDIHVEEMLYLYADGELPFEQQGALFAHLAESEEARLLLESVMQFRRMSRQEAFTVTPAMDAAFMQRLAQQRRAVPRAGRLPVPRSRWRRPLTISGAVAAVALLLVVFWSTPAPTAQHPAQTAPQPATEAVVMSAQYVYSTGVVVEAERQ